MRSKLTARKISVAFSAIVLAGLALTGAAYAVTSGTFTYSRPKTGYLMIPSAAFSVTDSSYVYHNFGYGLSSTGIACFIAPVNLPQGAKMTQLAMWYGTNDAAPGTLNLARVTAATGDQMPIASLATENTGGEGRMAARVIRNRSLQTVNNVRYGYYIHLCLTDTEQFSSARIRYSYASAGD